MPTPFAMLLVVRAPQEVLMEDWGMAAITAGLAMPPQLLSHKLPTSGQSLCSLGSALAQETFLYSAIHSFAAECTHLELIALVSHQGIVIKTENKTNKNILQIYEEEHKTKLFDFVSVNCWLNCREV